MDTGWSCRGHTMHRATYEFYRLPQLLFLLLFGTWIPVGYLCLQLNHKWEDPPWKTCPGTGLGSAMGQTPLPHISRTFKLQGFLVVLILIVLQMSGGLIWVFDCYLWQTAPHKSLYLHIWNTLCQSACYWHVSAIKLLLTINMWTATLNIHSVCSAVREGLRYH